MFIQYPRAGIWTHNFMNKSFFPLPLDQEYLTVQNVKMFILSIHLLGWWREGDNFSSCFYFYLLRHWLMLYIFCLCNDTYKVVTTKGLGRYHQLTYGYVRQRGHTFERGRYLPKSCKSIDLMYPNLANMLF